MAAAVAVSGATAVSAWALSADQGTTRTTPVSDSSRVAEPGDDNGGLRPPGVSDDGPGDDRGGARATRSPEHRATPHPSRTADDRVTPGPSRTPEDRDAPTYSEPTASPTRTYDDNGGLRDGDGDGSDDPPGDDHGGSSGSSSDDGSGHQ